MDYENFDLQHTSIIKPLLLSRNIFVKGMELELEQLKGEKSSTVTVSYISQIIIQ